MKALAHNGRLADGRAMLIGIEGTEAFTERMAGMAAEIEAERARAKS